MNEELAELFGAMIGDGCISQYKSGKRVALLTGNLNHDYEYYAKTIQPILRNNFKIEGYIYKRQKRNCVYLWMGKQVFDYFNSHGFPVGKKKEISIPRTIFTNKKHSIACLRGIFNTDGSIYKRYSKKYAGHSRVYNHFVIQFKMNSEATIRQIKEILQTLNIKTTKISKSENSWVVRITNQKGIGEFMRIVCPNSYHVERYLNSHKRSSSYGPLAQR